MSPYKRAKREDALKTYKKTMSFEIGSVRDSFAALQAQCNDKACQLLKSLELEHDEIMEIAFWTADFPELIGVATFIKNNAGLLTYSLDYSQSTL